MEVKEIINNLKSKTNIVITANQSWDNQKLVVFEGTVNKYKKLFSNSIIEIMSIYKAQFTDKNTVEITFYVNISLLKDFLRREGK